MPLMFIIAGCNGAGKTTAAYSLLEDTIEISQFVNADEIARGLSPFNPESVSIIAGRIMLSRIEQLMNDGQDFAFETTLSTLSYAALIRKAKAVGYEVHLLFFYLQTSNLAKERVKERVLRGGHNIPEEVVERRYIKGLKNLVNLFIPLCHSWEIFDNSKNGPIIIANGKFASVKRIFNREIFQKIETYGK